VEKSIGSVKVLRRSRSQPTQKKPIAAKFAAEKVSEDLAARQAWRSLLIPAVGSASFFASAVVGFIRTYRKHGFPKNAFTGVDYALMGLPFAIIGMTLFYQAEEAELAETAASEG
jgi:hypothetical protein